MSMDKSEKEYIRRGHRVFMGRVGVDGLDVKDQLKLSREMLCEIARWEAYAKDREAELERLREACESAMHDLRSHEGDDEGGYLDDTEQDLRKALGLCPNCKDGMEQSGRARITCGACGGSGMRKEGE